MRLINLIFQSKCFHFVLAAHNEVVGRICFSRKNRAMHSSNLKSKMWNCWKTCFLPLISAFTFVNTELRNISNDQMTLKYLIINYLRCHLSFSLSPQVLSIWRDFYAEFLVCVFSFPQLAALMKTSVCLGPIAPVRLSVQNPWFFSAWFW